MTGVQTCALPISLALCSDRHGIFQRAPQERESLTEQLRGGRQPTQFGRALGELGTQAIFARSPQAKGRSGRLWGTFQDRLVSELRLAGATTLAEANGVLQRFLPRSGARFGVPAALPGSAYRPLAPGVDLEAIVCFKYSRTVARDNTVRFGGQTVQLQPSRERASYARAPVEVQERLSGRLVVVYRGQRIATRARPTVAGHAPGPHRDPQQARSGDRGDSALRSSPAAPQARCRSPVAQVGVTDKITEHLD